MSQPVVFISHFAIKEGRRDAYLRLQREVTPNLQAEKPRTLAFLVFLDDEGMRMSVVHVFGDAASMDAHFEGADQRARAAYEFLVPLGWEIYGSPSEAALETMRQAAASAGVSLTVEPRYEKGFLRLAPQVQT
jgi:hypothetical protein